MWGKRKKNTPASHPDPAIALKLQHIQTLLDSQRNLDHQIRLSLTEIKSARDGMDDAVSRHSVAFSPTRADQFNRVMAACTGRVEAAENNIVMCQEKQAGTQQAIDNYIASQGLDTYDLAYLNLDKRK